MMGQPGERPEQLGIRTSLAKVVPRKCCVDIKELTILVYVSIVYGGTKKKHQHAEEGVGGFPNRHGAHILYCIRFRLSLNVASTRVYGTS